MKTIVITIIVVIILIIVGVIVMNNWGAASSNSAPVNQDINTENNAPSSTNNVGSVSANINSNPISASISVATEKVDTSKMDLFTVVSSAMELKTFAVAAKEANLSQSLTSGGPYTLFVPTNSAFGKLDQTVADQLVKNPQKLAQAVKYHIVSGTYSTQDLANMPSVQNLNGTNLSISKNASGTMVIGKAQVIGVEIPTKNGIIHVVDSVLLP